MQLHLTNQLKRTIQDDPTKCVLFVGAGLSTFGVLKNGKGLPNWDILKEIRLSKFNGVVKTKPDEKTGKCVLGKCPKKC